MRSRRPHRHRRPLAVHQAAPQPFDRTVAIAAQPPRAECDLRRIEHKRDGERRNDAEAAELAALYSEIGATRLISTRLDTARRYGGILAAADAGKLAFAEMGVAPGIGDGGSHIIHYPWATNPRTS